MVIKATEALAKAQSEQFAVLSARLASLEKAGGVSQSAPRGTADAVVQKSRQGGKLWGGLLGGAPAQAMSKM
jgi:fructose/tagatose bisphosphate aldolase